MEIVQSDKILSIQNSFLSRICISFLIFIAPFSLGPFPLVGVYHYKYILSLIALLLFLLNFENLIKNPFPLPQKYYFFSLWFASSFFTSLTFGLDYTDVSSYTFYDSTYSGVLSDILVLIPLQFFLLYLIHLTVESFSDIIDYAKVFVLSGLFVNAWSLIAIVGGIGYNEENRLSLMFEDANYLGRFEVFFLTILIIYLFYKRNNILIKLIYVVNIVYGLMLIMYTSSRAALLTFAVVTTIIVLFVRSKVFKISLISFNFLIFSYLIVSIAARRGVGGGSGILSSFLDLSNATRVALNYSAIQIFWDYPVWGIGYRNFYNIYINYNYVPDFIPVLLKVSVVHSWLFSVLAELGLFGAIPLCIILYLIFKNLIKSIIERIDFEGRFAALLVFGLFFVFLFNGLFFPVFFPEVLYPIIFGLALGYVKLIYKFDKNQF